MVEHDLSVLDYLSDFICCLYGVPGVYGVVTLPSGVREGTTINTPLTLPTSPSLLHSTCMSFYGRWFILS